MLVPILKNELGNYLNLRQIILLISAFLPGFSDISKFLHSIAKQYYKTVLQVADAVLQISPNSCLWIITRFANFSWKIPEFPCYMHPVKFFKKTPYKV